MAVFDPAGIKLPPLKKAHRFSKHKGNLRRITKIWHENFPKNKKKTISFIGEKDFPESRSTLDYTCPRAGAHGQVKTRVSLDSGKSIFVPMKVIAIKTQLEKATVLSLGLESYFLTRG